jgi:hypothetical protein
MILNEFKKIVNASKSFNEVSKKIYGNNYYGNRQTIKKRIIEYSIDISHFDFKSKGGNKYGRYFKTPLNEILISGSTYNTTHLKNRLYDEGLKERKCELCGQDENWCGKRMSLILDHINGIHNDNRFINLRIICPNCDATLSTHCGKNIKNKFKSNNTKQKNKKIIDIIKISENQRKVKRPSFEQLQNEVKELGYTGTGKKYGVSDNAIRKWIIFYKKHTLS